MTLIDGRKTRQALMPALMEKVKGFSFRPTLAIIQVGDLPDSTAFIAAKKNFAKKIGVAEKHVHLSSDTSQNKLEAEIKKSNQDKKIHGIIVQLPLPKHLDQNKTIDAISPDKDADGLRNMKITPATARGIRELLGFYNISIKDKTVCIIGKSDLVGKPITDMCLQAGARVLVCDRKTKDIPGQTKKADIIISATGSPGLIGAKYVRRGQVVVDVGITRNKEGKLEGDVNFDEVKDIVEAITPVPGGVGPMTVFGLFENLIDLCEVLH